MKKINIILFYRYYRLFGLPRVVIVIVSSVWKTNKISNYETEMQDMEWGWWNRGKKQLSRISGFQVALLSA